MYHSHRKHVVIPDKPEIPIIDSSHAKSFNWSSENIKLAKITLLDKIDKVVDGVTTSTAYIYFDHEKNYVDVDIVTNYISSYMFGYRKTSQLKDVEIGETVENIYTSHLEAFDPVEEELAYGKNMNIIYNLGKEVLEDAIMISEEMSEELAVNYYYDIKFTLSKNQILRNIYSKEKGVYQPIPKVGQEIDKYTVASIINNASNLDILLMNNETTNTDTRYLTHGGRVVDVDVISAQSCKSQQLEQYRLDNLSYLQQSGY